MACGFGNRVVVEGVDIVLAPGEIVVVLGPNGVGKSTLVKSLARQLKPMRGKATLGGTDVWELSAMQFAAQVAYVSQNIEPGQDLTVQEIVMLGRNPHQSWWQWYGSAEDKQAVDAALDATELKELRSKYLSQLSGGERQRAMIATALAQQPAFMLLDEPMAHLDLRHQLEVVVLLQRLRDTKRIGSLLVLHDLNLAARAADRVVLIKAESHAPSRIAASGRPAEVLVREHLRSVFGVEVSVITDNANGQIVFSANLPSD